MKNAALLAVLLGSLGLVVATFAGGYAAIEGVAFELVGPEVDENGVTGPISGAFKLIVWFGCCFEENTYGSAQYGQCQY